MTRDGVNDHSHLGQLALELRDAIAAGAALAPLGEHAALAFRFVRWACDVGGEPVRERARQAFHAALVRRGGAREPAPDAPDMERALEAHGQLAPNTRAALRERTWREVLEPAARDLFG